MENLFGSDSRDRRVAILAVAAATVAVAVLVIGALHTFSSPGPSAPARHFVCDSCGHEWDAPLAADPKCPQCGGRPVLKSRYRCPKCKETFVGLERQKLDVGKFRYRLPGTAKWLDRIPTELTCPHCKFTSADIYQHGLPAQPGGESSTSPPRGEYE